MQRSNATAVVSPAVLTGLDAKPVLEAPLREVYYDDNNNDISYLGYAGEDDLDSRDERETVTAEVELYERRDDDELFDGAAVCGKVEDTDLDCRDGAATTPQRSLMTPVKQQPAVPCDLADDPAAERVPIVAPRRRRHNPYARRVMPDWAYVFTSLAYTHPEAPETVVGAPADVGSALMQDVMPVATEEDLGRTPAAAMRSSRPPVAVQPESDDMTSASHPQFENAPAFFTSPEEMMYSYDAWQHQQGYSSRKGHSSADGATAPAPHAVMCCYWKLGHCSKGTACWYSHEGTDDTPCHYGATCRKGHRHLARAHPDVPAVAEAPKPVKPSDAEAEVTPAGTADEPKAELDNIDQPYSSAEGIEYMHQAAMMNSFAGYPPRRYVHDAKPPRPSAPLMEVETCCPHCAAVGTLRTQQCPLYDGPRVRQATRAHCTACQRTFML